MHFAQFLREALHVEVDVFSLCNFSSDCACGNPVNRFSRALCISLSNVLWSGLSHYFKSVSSQIRMPFGTQKSVYQFVYEPSGRFNMGVSE